MAIINGVANTILEVLSEYNRKESIENLPISVDILKEIILARTDLRTITWTEVPVTTKNLLANIKFYYPVPNEIRTMESPTTVIIRFTKDLNFCWRRFVLAKEMCHCLIDNNENRVSNINDLKKQIEGLASRVTVSLLNKDEKIASEQWAELMALEILYPMELRLKHVKALKSGTITPHMLALRYRIPEEYAEFGMGEAFLEASAKALRGDKYIK